MKATFENIGPIKEAELELGDLTIIAGQNNTGKTYLAYTLYGFLKFCQKGSHLYGMIHSHKRANEQIREVAQQIEETGTASMELEEYKEMLNRLGNEVHATFSQDVIHQVFSAQRGGFEDAYFQIDLEKHKINENMAYRIPLKDKIMRCFFRDKKLVFEMDDLENMVPSIIEAGIEMLLVKAAFDICPEPCILSSERLGISLFYKEMDFAKNRLVEKLQNLSDDKNLDSFNVIQKQSARYAKPIKDNIDFTRDLSNIQKQKSELADDGFSRVKRMMGGDYKVVKDEIKFISKTKGKNKFNIPLHLASSSARGLSDLYFYLKHSAAPGQLLIIDEPESHLSPTNQILMARLLVFCVNKGIKVLITTHSDYIIRETNHLIMLNGEFEKKSAFLEKHKKDYTENDHLNPESVRAYICEKGSLTKCNIDKKGIHGMTVFDDAIDGMNRISAELVDMKRDPVCAAE